jgi:predicted unusual protein kinase regulating ubiquinone biosynthesis (AarF/ABC1/UbiB family)
MKTVQKDKFEPADVHGRNVMVRPGSNELVIVDVGLFDLMRDEE